MRAVDIIIKKRDGGELTREEIQFFVKGFTSGEIQDYQASAWAMAVLLKGMTARETTDLTLAMAESGEVLDLSGVVPIAVDKHSTGGVGDKTTITVAPIVAACGLPVGKMSGRGLGFSGGTLDKLESIPGFRTNLSRDEFIQQLREIGFVLSGQSVDLAPADGKMYALRDVTGTVQSIPLIASSVMSKKIAAGANAILLDVKTGLGAFMQTLEEAKELAEVMVSIGKLSGRAVVAVLSDMNQPLGEMVGNAMELAEAVRALSNEAPPDYMEHCLDIAARLLVLGHKAKDVDGAKRMALDVIENGAAFAMLRRLVIAQGGDASYINHLEKLPQAKERFTVAAPQTGYIAQVHARKVGETAVALGAGRAMKTDVIDPAVGIRVFIKVGDYIETGQPMFEVHSNTPQTNDGITKMLLDAVLFSEEKTMPLPLFYGMIG